MRIAAKTLMVQKKRMWVQLVVNIDLSAQIVNDNDVQIEVLQIIQSGTIIFVLSSPGSS